MASWLFLQTHPKFGPGVKDTDTQAHSGRRMVQDSMIRVGHVCSHTLTRAADGSLNRMHQQKMGRGERVGDGEVICKMGKAGGRRGEIVAVTPKEMFCFVLSLNRAGVKAAAAWNQTKTQCCPKSASRVNKSRSPAAVLYSGAAACGETLA